MKQLYTGSSLYTRICHVREPSQCLHNTELLVNYFQDEMCFGFFYYYPSTAKFDTCVSYDVYAECDFKYFMNEDDKDDKDPNTSSHLVASLVAVISSLFLSLA